ncbi:MAG TPA: formate/nitrite transporter family protein [Pirellulales bacterium]|nr:formate/nitrite transporter family protein [Pirellulales bacterium]
MLRLELREGRESIKAPALVLVLSGISAGLDLGFSPLMVAVMHQLTGDLSHAANQIASANAYAIGFIFVVIGRSELFTEQTSLAVLPVLNGDAPIAALLRLWFLVYCSNLAGGAVFALLTSFVGPGLQIVSPETLGELARQTMSYSSRTILLSAVLAGWLMGLLSWLVAAGRGTISQLVLVWLVTSTIGLAHLHHAVAGSIELMMASFAGHGVGLSEIGRFHLCTTLGNIVGGAVFVALIKYGHVAWAAEGVVDEKAI